MKHRRRRQSNVLCLLRPGARTSSFRLTPNRVHKGSRLHSHARGETRSLAWDDGHLCRTKVLQPIAEAFPLQAPLTESVWDLFSLPSLVSSAPVAATLATLHARLWPWTTHSACWTSTPVLSVILASVRSTFGRCRQRSLTPLSFTTLQANVHVTASILPYYRSTLPTIVVPVRR